MNKKAMTFLFVCILSAAILSGCDKSDAPSSEVERLQSLASINPDVPNEAVQRLQTALEAEPITIKKEDWTLDTICQATYINGKNLTIPCTLRDLGEGFEILEDEKHRFVFNEERHTITTYMTYYGSPVVLVQVKDCESVDDFWDAPVKSLMFTINEINDNHDVIFPVSVNGVTLCSGIETKKERMYFMDVEWEHKPSGSYSMGKFSKEFGIGCSYVENEVRSLNFFIEPDYY